MSKWKVPMADTMRVNTTTPAPQLRSFHTAQPFVVYHLGLPDIAAQAWSLAITGEIERPLQLDLDALADLPQSEVTAVHECAGSPLHTTVPVRRVANVVWSGVRLRSVLTLARIRDGSAYVWAAGADSGVYAPTGQHSDCYMKDIPLSKALADEVLIATAMNGRPLTARHGAPARLVVPGFYGTNSVKWLSEISVQRTRAQNYFTTALYNDVVEGQRARRPVWDVAPHALIVAPSADAVLCAEPTEIWGWAWSASPIVRVEVSTNGGAEWAEAIIEARESFAWQRFSMHWHPAAGLHTLACRATDLQGNCQPLENARNSVIRLPVRVRA